MQVDSTPKAILYCWPTSVLSTVPRLCLHEKNYGDDEYVLHHVDITKGENFSLPYLRINPNGIYCPNTCGARSRQPTSKYAFESAVKRRRAESICAFVDECKPPSWTPGSTSKVVPVLFPTIAREKELTDLLVALVRDPYVDPNFLDLAARDAGELGVKLGASQGTMLATRRLALKRYVHMAHDELSLLTPVSALKSWEQQVVNLLEDKAAANQALFDIYSSDLGLDRQPEFFEASRAAWTVHVSGTLSKLEASMVGPFALGDHLSIADCYIIAWLTRLVSLSHGNPGPGGIHALEPNLGGHRIGAKLVAFWQHWIQRKSFRKVFTAAFWPEPALPR
ncbi:uncharacterized protein LOC62_03G004941 [Vanrija pseudolonga]|uniref:GST C-terminal domain-containing protein n=1 Tax=Vanrija pseudolonga TaxID=143232 RepID=A0AAF1BID7_9TREE|nr:hypothetical protein LOC62_03G004941 [Vanrija pseudolonga]